MDLSAITNLRHECDRASHWLRGTALLHALVEREPDLAAVGAGSLAELVRDGPDRGAAPPVASWRITAALLRQFELDELVGVGLLVRLTPGLLAIARSLEWGRGIPWYGAELLVADLVSTAWEELHRQSGVSIAFPERTLLRSIRRRLEAERTSARRRGDHEEPAGWLIGDYRDPTPVPVLDELASTLRSRRGDMALADLQLIYRHRVLGFSFPELAAASGTSVGALEQRSYRAEAALCA